MDGATFVFVLLIFLGLGVARMNLMEVQRRVTALSRIEGKLDLLLKQSNLGYDPYAKVPPEVAEAVQKGQKIKAIKLYRQASGVGLKEAKDFVEGVQRRAGV
jgi:ribosomal protein L7/L12